VITMSSPFLDIVVTPAVAGAQTRAYGASYPVSAEGPPAPLGPDEAAFVAARDSFYLASVGETGWPYIQHRGGPPGFLRVKDPRTLAFADMSGNRQLVSVGNVSREPRVALFLMDYPGRTRLKILGRARFVEGREAEDLLPLVELPGLRGRIERVALIEVAAWDWNCPQSITPRYTLAEVEAMTAPLRERIAELERERGAR